MLPSSLGLGKYAPVPAEEDLRPTADVLNGGEKVAILIGQSVTRRVTALSGPMPNGGRRGGAPTCLVKDQGQ